MNDLHDLGRRAAKDAAIGSDDKDRQVGAAAVCNGAVIATGRNRFPIGVTPKYDRSAKLSLITHAEADLIVRAANHGVRLFLATIYVTRHPCSECAKLIIGAGFARVVCPPPEPESRWFDSQKLAEEMFRAAGIEWSE